MFTPLIFHFKNRTNQNWGFFYFKKIDREFQNLAVAVGQVCFRLANNVCALLPTHYMIVYAQSFFMRIYLTLRFFSCTVSVFFAFKIAKLVMHFFACFTLALGTVFWYALCTFICVPGCIFFCILTFYVKFPVCLIFYNGLTHCFIHFFCQNTHFFVFLFFCSFSRCHFLVFFVFLAAQFAYFCVAGCFCLLCCAMMFCLCCFIFFCWFFGSFHTAVFFAYFVWFEPIWICWFWWVFALLPIFCLLLYIYTQKIDPHPFFCWNSPQIILSGHLNHPANFLGFFLSCHASKNKHNMSIFGSFPVVFRSACFPDPQCTHKNPYLPSRIRKNPYTAYHQKHDVRGNFPGHTAQIRACMTIFVPACIVSVSPHAPYTPRHPSKLTHPHPFAPTYTRPYTKLHLSHV